MKNTQQRKWEKGLFVKNMELGTLKTDNPNFAENKKSALDVLRMLSRPSK